MKIPSLLGSLQNDVCFAAEASIISVPKQTSFCNYTADIDIAAYPKLKAHVQDLIRESRIIDDWDEMLRLIWNTVYIDKVVQQLRKEGYAISDDDLKSVWPTRQRHLNVYGAYLYEAEWIGQQLDLRPLRLPRSEP